jgi:hypothetical protein
LYGNKFNLDAEKSEQTLVAEKPPTHEKYIFRNNFIKRLFMGLKFINEKSGIY